MFPQASLRKINLTTSKKSLTDRHNSKTKCRSRSNEYSFLCKKHTSNGDFSSTSRFNNDNKILERAKNFVEECKSEIEVFNKDKVSFGKQINWTQKKALATFNRLKKKEKNKNSGLSDNFKEFMSQREFKRKLIGNLINQSCEAEKNYIVLTLKPSNNKE